MSIAKKRRETPTQKAVNQNEPIQPILGEADARPPDHEVLAKTFALVLQMRAVTGLKLNPRNARTHSKKQIRQLAAAMKAMGFIVPIIVDEEGVVLAGHGRLEAAQLNGQAEVPTIRVNHLTPELKRTFSLADNRLAELAGWDEDLLRDDLLELSQLDLDFNFELTGFDTTDVDRLAAPKLSKPANDAEEVVPELERGQPAVSVPGDLWKLGRHLLYCGSALEAASYEILMGDQQAQMVFSDPPYNVKIDGHVCGLGSVHHRPFQMASGEMSRDEFTEFLASAMKPMAEHSVDGAIHYICMDWRHVRETLAAARGRYKELKNICVWNKTNAGMGTFYRSKHEFVLAFKVGTGPHINNFGLGERGRYRTNVWDYAGVNTFKRGRMDELRTHPTVKPLALVVDAIKDCSNRRGIVLDPFVGSGTTLLAAEKTGRIGRAIELDPHYVDAAIGRWQDLTGQSAVHAETERTFDELVAAAPHAANVA